MGCRMEQGLVLNVRLAAPSKNGAGRGISAPVKLRVTRRSQKKDGTLEIEADRLFANTVSTVEVEAEPFSGNTTECGHSSSDRDTPSSIQSECDSLCGSPQASPPRFCNVKVTEEAPPADDVEDDRTIELEQK